MTRRLAPLWVLIALVLPAEAFGQGPVTAEEDLSIGMVDGPPEYTFARLAGVAAHPDGSIYVLDRGEKTVRVFDASGRHVESFGRSGRGPGEFRDPNQLALFGDTLAVYDQDLKRLTLFDRGGDLIETGRVGVASWFPIGLEPLGDGTFLLGVESGYGIPPQPDREGKAWLIRIDAEGSVLDTLLVVPGADLLVYRTEDVISSIRAPFQRGPRWDVAPDGQIAYGRGEEYEISIYRYSGGESDARVVDSIRRDAPDLAVSDGDLDQYRARYLEREGLSSQMRHIYREMMREAEFPETWPAYEALLFDDRGLLWVKRPAHHGESLRDWHLLDPGGEHVGTVRLPRALEVHAIVGASIYGVERDVLDVQYVKRYRVPR